MHYVYRRHKETKQEYTKVDIYLNKFGKVQNQNGKRGYKEVCPMNI